MLLVRNGKNIKASNVLSIWDKIYDEYIKEFGMPDDFVTMLGLEEQLAILKGELVLEGNKKLQNDIKMVTAELNRMEKAGVKMRFAKSMAILNSQLGYQLNNEITVVEYYSNVEYANELSKARRSANV